MSMTESEAIKRCNMLVNGFNVDNATETAFTDVERGYATFATMVEFAETCKMALEIVQELYAIGTVSEFRENKNFLEFLYNTIQPNEMEQYLSMYHASDEKGE